MESKNPRIVKAKRGKQKNQDLLKSKKLVDCY